jgi:hypothetical protein
MVLPCERLRRANYGATVAALPDRQQREEKTQPHQSHPTGRISASSAWGTTPTSLALSCLFSWNSSRHPQTYPSVHFSYLFGAVVILTQDAELLWGLVKGAHLSIFFLFKFGCSYHVRKDLCACW